MSPAPIVRHLRVAIAGSGFGGLGTAIRLKQTGENDFLVFERAGALGGVWRDNSYPGCACDVQSHLYSFSFARNPDWTRSYSGQAEIWAYLEACVDRFGVRPHLRFNHAILDATWDEDAQRWTLLTSAGVFTADVFVAAVGALSEPRVPDLPGLESFKGRLFHSAAWDHGYDLAGKRVAVVGTGASAIQFIPKIQPEVKTLAVFQRSPPWILPRRDRALRAFERRALRASPALQKALRASIQAKREISGAGFFYPALARLAQRLAAAHLTRSVPDAALRRKLTPSYTLGCKRVLISDDFYPAITQANVEVVTDAIVRVTPSSVVTTDGREREVDAIIFGTGFRIQEYPFGRHIHGREGKTLAETWAKTMTAHVGTTVAGFPNLFVLQGPNTALGHSSVLIMIEAQIDHLVHALAHMRETGATSVEPRPEAQAAFVSRVDRDMRGTVWTSGGCASWYLDQHGRNSALWPGFTFTFVQRVAPFHPEEYRMTRSTAHAKRARQPSPAERILFRVARALTHLPAHLQRTLSGKPAICRDGYTLDPALQLILAVDPSLKKPWPEDALHLRKTQDRAATSMRGPLPPVHATRDLEIDGAAGKLRARLYSTATTGSAGAPLLVYFHGGGFVFGNLETHDVGCRLLCAHGGFHVLAVEYRLVPEHRFPAAIDDGLAALAWAFKHAAELGADPSRIGVGGDSAGANISAVVSQLARRTKHAPACQLLIYPPTDRAQAHPSMNGLAEGFLLTRASVEWFHAQYAAAVGADSSDPRISPLVAPDKGALPPALVVTAGFDPLRDEGEAYAAALRAAGNIAFLRRFDGLIHGFFNLTGIHDPSRDAVIAIAGATRALFEARPVADASLGAPVNGVHAPMPPS